MKARLLVLTAVISALSTVSALAQTAPPTLPTRDVTIVYRTEGEAKTVIPGGIPGNVRLAWKAARQTMRLQPEGREQVLLVDLATTKAMLIDRGLQSAIDLPVKAKDLDPVRLQQARLTRQGQAVVAGLACTDYSVSSSRGHGTICLTGDGVALRASGEIDGRSGGFTALSVSYTPLPPDMFDVPQGYMSLALPNLLQGLSRYR